MQIVDTKIKKGESDIVRIPVGQLPSGNSIVIRAHIYRSKNPGPTALILAGIHGDEINGIETVRRTIAEGIYDNLTSGNVIVIPVVNMYGFINFSRDVPDGKDVNRNFPGSFQGSLASRVARTLTKIILPHVDFGIDLHTGGASRYNYPQTRYYINDPLAKELSISFGAPLAIEKTLINKSLRKAAFDMNIPMLVYEGGESVRLDGHSITKGIEGIKRVLHMKKMLKKAPPRFEKIHVITKTKWIRSPYSGIFVWSKRSGMHTLKGEPLGVVYSTNGTKSVVVLSSLKGIVIGHNNASVVNQGDALFHIGYDYKIV